MILGLTPGQALKGSLAFVPLVCISDIVTKVLVPVDVIGVACVRQPSLSDPWGYRMRKSACSAFNLPLAFQHADPALHDSHRRS